MNPTESSLLQALQAVIDPNTGRDFVTTKQLRDLRIDGADVSFAVQLGYPAKTQLPALRKALIAAARTVAGVGSVSVDSRRNISPHLLTRGVPRRSAR